MPVPDFSPGEVLTAAAMDSIGMWLVKSQAVGASAVSSVDVTSCFSADYDNYVISLAGIEASGAVSISLSLLSGSTPTSSGWFGTEFYTGVGTTTITGQLSANNTGGAYCSAGSAASGVSSIIDIESPFLTQHTKFEYRVSASDFFRWGFAFHNANTSYNGLRLSTVGGGTIINGTISVYGRRK